MVSPAVSTPPTTHPAVRPDPPVGHTASPPDPVLGGPAADQRHSRQPYDTAVDPAAPRVPTVRAVPPPLTPSEQETVDALYNELKPQALSGARDFVLARTPAQYQLHMMEKIDADFPPPEVEDPPAVR